MQTLFHEFIDIWVAWWNASEPISQHILWGHPVFFWGRCGKAMELIAAFFLLYEIFGRESSSETAKKFAQTFSLASTLRQKPIQQFKRTYQEAEELIRSGLLPVIRKTWIFLLAWIAVFVVAWSLVPVTEWYAVVGLFFACYLAMALVVLAAMFLFFVLAEIARLYSWLAEMEPRLRVLNLAILAIGIMFDLLAT